MARCKYCGELRARVVVWGGYAHKYCLEGKSIPIVKSGKLVRSKPKGR